MKYEVHAVGCGIDHPLAEFDDFETARTAAIMLLGNEWYVAKIETLRGERYFLDGWCAYQNYVPVKEPYPFVTPVTNTEGERQ
jgi:hypothetical protein